LLLLFFFFFGTAGRCGPFVRDLGSRMTSRADAKPAAVT